MKVVIILLVLITVSFVAVMVYGVTREEPARAETRSSDGCKSGPPPIDDEDPEDALEEWCPPDFGNAVDWMRAKFGPSLKIDRPEISLTGSGSETRQVPPAPKKELRVARIALTSGRAARVESQRLDGKNESICLCQAEKPLNPIEFQGCKPRWLAKQMSGEKKCATGSEGTLTFGPLGGAMTFASERPAQLVVK